MNRKQFRFIASTLSSLKLKLDVNTWNITLDHFIDAFRYNLNFDEDKFRKYIGKYEEI